MNNLTENITEYDLKYWDFLKLDLKVDKVFKKLNIKPKEDKKQSLEIIVSKTKK